MVCLSRVKPTIAVAYNQNPCVARPYACGIVLTIYSRAPMMGHKGPHASHSILSSTYLISEPLGCSWPHYAETLDRIRLGARRIKVSFTVAGTCTVSALARDTSVRQPYSLPKGGSTIRPFNRGGDLAQIPTACARCLDFPPRSSTSQLGLGVVPW